MLMIPGCYVTHSSPSHSLSQWCFLDTVTFYLALSDAPENPRSSPWALPPPLRPLPLSPLSPSFGCPCECLGAMDASQQRLQCCPPSRANKASFWRAKKGFLSPLSPSLHGNVGAESGSSQPRMGKTGASLRGCLGQRGASIGKFVPGVARWVWKCSLENQALLPCAQKHSGA